MRLLVFISMLMINVCSAQDLKELRAYLPKGEKSEVAAQQLMQKSDALYKQKALPIYKGFYSIGQLFMAKHVGNPLKKMSYFKDGKKNLDNTIKTEPSNLELRVFRLMIQEQAPKFLNYRDNITEDKNFILKNYQNSKDQDLKLFIKKYMKL